MTEKSFVGLNAHEWVGVIFGAFFIVPIALAIAGSGALANDSNTATTTGTYFNTGYAGADTGIALPSFFYAMAQECDSGVIKLQWASVPNLLKYKIARDGVLIYEGTKQTFEDRGLVAGSEHRYDLYVVLGGGAAGPLTRVRTAPPVCVNEEDEDEEEDTDSDTGTNTATTTGTNTGNTGTIASTTIQTVVAVAKIPLLVIPSSTYLYPEQEIRFAVGPGPNTVSWKISEGKSGGSITDEGLYRAPRQPGIYHVIAKTNEDKYTQGYATVRVMELPKETATGAVASTTTTAATTTTISTGTTIDAPKPVKVAVPVTVVQAPAKAPTKASTQSVVEESKKTETSATPVFDKKQNEVVLVQKPSLERAIAPAPEVQPDSEPLPLPVRIEAERIRIVADLIETKSVAIDTAKADLKQLIDVYVTDVGVEDKDAAVVVQTALGKIVDERLSGAEDPTKEELETLSVAIVTDLKKAELLPEGEEEKIDKVLTNLSEGIAAQTEALEDQGAGLLFKDTNNDGISDYESMRVYGIDPEAPSPVSEYEGRRITAAEKLLLGFDPTKEELVAVVPEEPEASGVAATSAYKVEEVSLTEDKKLALSGKALPNSFITLYIYSTPVVVTVRADENGEWSYTLDKELGDGSHTVYTATVNNSGKILAKSPGYLFTKTAQAATLDSVLPASASGAESDPRLLSAGNLYLIIGALVAVLLLVLLILGMRARKSTPGGPTPV